MVRLGEIPLLCPPICNHTGIILSLFEMSFCTLRCWSHYYLPTNFSTTFQSRFNSIIQSFKSHAKLQLHFIQMLLRLTYLYLHLTTVSHQPAHPSHGLTYLNTTELHPLLHFALKVVDATNLYIYHIHLPTKIIHKSCHFCSMTHQITPVQSSNKATNLKQSN